SRAEIPRLYERRASSDPPGHPNQPRQNQADAKLDKLPARPGRAFAKSLLAQFISAEQCDRSEIPRLGYRPGDDPHDNMPERTLIGEHHKLRRMRTALPHSVKRLRVNEIRDRDRRTHTTLPSPTVLNVRAGLILRLRFGIFSRRRTTSFASMLERGIPISSIKYSAASLSDSRMSMRVWAWTRFPNSSVNRRIRTSSRPWGFSFIVFPSRKRERARTVRRPRVRPPADSPVANSSGYSCLQS